MEKKLYFNISDFGGRFSDTDDCPVARLLEKNRIKTAGVGNTMFGIGYKKDGLRHITDIVHFKTHYQKSLLFGLIKYWKTVKGFNLEDYFYISEKINKNLEYKAFITFNTN